MMMLTERKIESDRNKVKQLENERKRRQRGERNRIMGVVV